MVDKLHVLEQLAKAARDPEGFLATVKAVQEAAPRQLAMDQTSRELVAKLLQAAGAEGLQRRDIQRLTGLSRPFVGHILQEMGDDGCVDARRYRITDILGRSHGSVIYLWKAD